MSLGGGVDLFVSSDVFKEERGGSPDAIESFLKVIFSKEDGKFKEYIDAFFLSAYFDKKIGILYAHGSNRGKDWLYCDGEREKEVQSWIDSQDSKYACLILIVCNQHGRILQAKKSLLMLSDEKFSFLAISARAKSGFNSLFHPDKEVGEIDSYTIDYEINRLAKSES